MQHNGSLRYYSGRVTLRYDFVEPDQLDALVAGLAGRGSPLYVLVEHWGGDRFRERFRRHSRCGALEWTPVYLYDLEQREAPRHEPLLLK
jgi:hypothetical protein